MAQTFDDLNLPNAVVARIAKELLPENVAIGKEARIALAKAASVFVLYVTSASNTTASKFHRKTINGTDVLQAMEDTGFNMFLEPLKENLENFKKLQQEKKNAIAKRKQENAPNSDQTAPVESEMDGNME